MRLIKNTGFYHIRFITTLLVIFLFTAFQKAMAQEPPPRPVEITVTAQGLSFGAFSHGNTGGSVIINSGGLRSGTGDVILLSLGFSYSAAYYKLVADPGTVISILNGSNATLTRTGGGSMTMTIGACSPVSPFVIATTPPAFTDFYVGGTLSVGNPTANPTGSYTGTFDVTFVQE